MTRAIKQYVDVYVFIGLIGSVMCTGALVAKLLNG